MTWKKKKKKERRVPQLKLTTRRSSDWVRVVERKFQTPFSCQTSSYTIGQCSVRTWQGPTSAHVSNSWTYDEKCHARFKDRRHLFLPVDVDLVVFEDGAGFLHLTEFDSGKQSYHPNNFKDVKNWKANWDITKRLETQLTVQVDIDFRQLLHFLEVRFGQMKTMDQELQWWVFLPIYISTRHSKQGEYIIDQCQPIQSFEASPNRIKNSHNISASFKSSLK